MHMQVKKQQAKGRKQKLEDSSTSNRSVLMSNVVTPFMLVCG